MLRLTVMCGAHTLIVGAYHSLSEFLGADRGILRQFAESRCVEPACTRLGLLRCQIVIRVWLQRVGILDILHQAGVESYDIKLHTGVFDGVDDLVRRHNGLSVLTLVQIICAVAAGKSAAVIPQHQNVSVRRIIVFRPYNEVCKILRLRHAGSRIKHLHCLKLASAYKVPSYSGVLYPFREPAV